MPLQNFRQVLASLDVRAALDELEVQSGLWRAITLRQDYPGSAHHDTETIFLRAPARLADVMNEVESVAMPALDCLPACAGLVLELLKAVDATEIGRVMAVKLKAGGSIDAHCDEGAYAERFTRAHISLISDVGNEFRCGGEAVHMEPGTAWWFDHHSEHSVSNASERDRIHLIVDFVAPTFGVLP